MTWLDKIPLSLLIVLSLTLGLAPFFPEPHLWEKLKMLVQGTLTRPLDIFDLILHAAAPLLLILKILRMAVTGTFDSGARY
ncbi:MAG: RND transporter [Gammaproteobacteria bacterium]